MSMRRDAEERDAKMPPDDLPAMIPVRLLFQFIRCFHDSVSFFGRKDLCFCDNVILL
jgi:hypothetical protein